MEKNTLKASKRTTVGRKVKNLRKKGIVPANIYGKKIKSSSVSVSEKEFTPVYEKAGATGLVEVVIEGKNHPVLIHNVQYHPVTNQPLHIDFFQVDLKEKVTAQVPLKFAGESPAVRDKLGVLLTILDEIEVEALPADLPENIEVDLSELSAVDQSIKIEKLKVDSKIKIITDPHLDIVKVAPLVSKEAEQMVKKEEEEKKAALEEAPIKEKEEEAKEVEEKKEPQDKP